MVRVACHDYGYDCGFTVIAEIDEAVEIALNLVGNSGVVLFSPGTSSFDMFNGYEERGNAFKDSVMKFSPKK